MELESVTVLQPASLLGISNWLGSVTVEFTVFSARMHWRTLSSIATTLVEPSADRARDAEVGVGMAEFLFVFYSLTSIAKK
jgi:hypothetical protein